MSLREDILASKAKPRKVVPVEVPEWGLTVYVRVMTGLERDKYETSRVKETGNYRARFFAFTTCDESGKSQFYEADFADLNELDANGMDRVISEAMKINDFTNKGVDKAGEA